MSSLQRVCVMSCACLILCKMVGIIVMFLKAFKVKVEAPNTVNNIMINLPLSVFEPESPSGNVATSITLDVCLHKSYAKEQA